MFIHSRRLKSRIAVVLLLLPISFLGWFVFKLLSAAALQRMALVGWFVIGLLVLTVATLLWACVLLWRGEGGPESALPDPKKWTGPNSIKLSTRLQHSLGSCALLAYAVYSLVIDDLYIPANRGGIHLHGVAAGLMVGAACCAVVNMASVVIDHYDRRNNELTYAHVAAATQWLGWTFFLAALVKDFLP